MSLWEKQPSPHLCLALQAVREVKGNDAREEQWICLTASPLNNQALIITLNSSAPSLRHISLQAGFPRLLLFWSHCYSLELITDHHPETGDICQMLSCLENQKRMLLLGENPTEFDFGVSEVSPSRMDFSPLLVMNPYSRLV